MILSKMFCTDIGYPRSPRTKFLQNRQCMAALLMIQHIFSTHFKGSPISQGFQKFRTVTFPYPAFRTIGVERDTRGPIFKKS